MVLSCWNSILRHWLMIRTKVYLQWRSTRWCQCQWLGRDSFTWVKNGCHVLPPNLSLTSRNKAGLHGTFGGCLIEFLCTNLDGNLSFTFTASKLDHYLLSLLPGLSETTNKAQFLINMWHIKKARISSLTIWGKFYHLLKQFPCPFPQIYSTRNLQSTLEILQQFYIEMDTQPN